MIHNHVNRVFEYQCIPLESCQFCSHELGLLNLLTKQEPTQSDADVLDFRRRSRGVAVLFLHTSHLSTFPVALAGAALTLFQHQSNPKQAGWRAWIIVLWPAFPFNHHQVFQSAQVSHQRESEYEVRGIIGKCQPCDGRCLNAVPESVYFPFHRSARTSRLLLLPTYNRLSNPLWQDSWPWQRGKADLDIGPHPTIKSGLGGSVIFPSSLYLMFILLNMLLLHLM